MQTTARKRIFFPASSSTAADFKLFATYRYRLAAGTPGLLREQPADPVRRLLDECERSRPEVWRLLKKHVAGSLSRRTEQTDHGSD